MFVVTVRVYQTDCLTDLYRTLLLFCTDFLIDKCRNSESTYSCIGIRDLTGVCRNSEGIL